MADATDASELLKCTFCGKAQKQVRKLIAGPGVYICNECIDLCNEIIEEDNTEHVDIDFSNLPKPQEILEFLNQYVIGQEQAKRTLCVAVYNHYKRIICVDNESEKKDPQYVELGKSNVLLLGPTGCGKTYLAQTLARMLDVPFAMADATSLTEAGYVGDDVENILLRLIQAADYDIAKAERGIIYIDEIDKIAKKGASVSITRDVSGEGVQQALLKIIEGTEASVPPQGGRKHPHQECLSINTENILFIVGGAFPGLTDIIKKRLGSRKVGFEFTETKVIETIKTYRDEDLLAEVNADDLHKFGMIPEFIGRVPILSFVRELDIDSLKRILIEPKNALTKQYQKLFELDGVELVFSEGSLTEMAKLAMKRSIGARGLRSIMEEVLMEPMFIVPSDSSISKISITSKAVRGEAKPIYYREDSKTA